MLLVFALGRACAPAALGELPALDEPVEVDESGEQPPLVVLVWLTGRMQRLDELHLPDEPLAPLAPV